MNRLELNQKVNGCLFHLGLFPPRQAERPTIVYCLDYHSGKAISMKWSLQFITIRRCGNRSECTVHSLSSISNKIDTEPTHHLPLDNGNNERRGVNNRDCKRIVMCRKILSNECPLQEGSTKGWYILWKVNMAKYVERRNRRYPYSCGNKRHSGGCAEPF